ncbi:MAG: porin [Pseudomonadota bacterium]|nr:porin [Pseudomonadota bacterium]
MQKFPRNALFMATLLACASIAQAEDAPAAAPAAPAADAKPAGPTISDILTNSGVELKGYIDVAAEFTDLKSFSAGNPYKVFDADHSGLTMHQAAFTLDKLPKEGFGGLVNVTYGHDANVIKSYDTTAGDYLDVTQLFAQYAHGPLTVALGKFVTLAGAEVIDSSANTNFSRSLLFGQIPFTHTGVRATYAVDDTTNLIFGVNNGWDQLKDANTQKTVELGVTANPVKPLTLAASLYSGVEPVYGPYNYAAAYAVPLTLTAQQATAYRTQGNRTLFDFVGTYAASDKLSLVLNVDYAVQENYTNAAGASVDAKWYGAALYVNYAIDDSNRISIRGEQLTDDQGYRTGLADYTSHKDTEITLTYGYSPAKNFELRAEVRADSVDHDGVLIKQDGTSTKTGTTVALQGVYKF